MRTWFDVHTRFDVHSCPVAGDLKVIMADPKLEEGRLIFAFAHDLRSHLRTILTRVQLVQGSGRSTLHEQDALFLEEAAVAAGDMNRLLTSMVSFYDAVPTETTALPLMLRGALMESRPLLTETDASVTVQNDLEGAVPKALQWVVKELVANSCRFRGERKTEIGIHTRTAEPGVLEIEVSDNGSGVDAAWIEKIFLPFQRMHSRNEFPGHGLGLALCRRIVTANNGTIRAQSSAAGGLSVILSVPFTQKGCEAVGA
jgi:chemotaxis family two-component system sensor kinase Cph1